MPEAIGLHPGTPQVSSRVRGFTGHDGAWHAGISIN